MALRDTTSLREAIGELERLEPAGEALAVARERLAQLRAGNVAAAVSGGAPTGLARP